MLLNHLQYCTVIRRWHLFLAEYDGMIRCCTVIAGLYLGSFDRGDWSWHGIPCRLSRQIHRLFLSNNNHHGQQQTLFYSTTTPLSIANTADIILHNVKHITVVSPTYTQQTPFYTSATTAVNSKYSRHHYTQQPPQQSVTIQQRLFYTTSTTKVLI